MPKLPSDSIENMGFDQIDERKQDPPSIHDGNDGLNGALADQPGAQGCFRDAKIVGGFVQPVGRSISRVLFS